jgi:hypothetical protein
MVIKKEYNGFVPMPEDYDDFNNLKNGTIYNVKLTTVRNPVFLRKFFKMITIAYENRQIMEDASFNVFRKELIKRAGYYDEYIDLKGNKVYDSQSIAFENLDEEEFKILFSKVLDIIIKYVLIGLKGDELETHLTRMMSFG